MDPSSVSAPDAPSTLSSQPPPPPPVHPLISSHPSCQCVVPAIESNVSIAGDVDWQITRGLSSQGSGETDAPHADIVSSDMTADELLNLITTGPSSVTHSIEPPIDGYCNCLSSQADHPSTFSISNSTNTFASSSSSLNPLSPHVSSCLHHHHHHSCSTHESQIKSLNHHNNLSHVTDGVTHLTITDPQTASSATTSSSSSWSINQSHHLVDRNIIFPPGDLKVSPTKTTASSSSAFTDPSLSLSLSLDSPGHTRPPIPPPPSIPLDEVMIKNMDTGESVPLSQAGNLTRKCINPLNLHLIRLAHDYNSDEGEDTDAGTGSIGDEAETLSVETDGGGNPVPGSAGNKDFLEASSSALKQGGKQVKTKMKAGFKKVTKVGKDLVKGVKHNVESVKEKTKDKLTSASSSSKAESVVTVSTASGGTPSSSSTPSTSTCQSIKAASSMIGSNAIPPAINDPPQVIPPPQSAVTATTSGCTGFDGTGNQFRIKGNRKGAPDFEGLKLLQEMHDCRGAIWCMKWSFDGQLLALAGQDQLVRVYCASQSWKYFTQLRNKASGQNTSPCSTKEKDKSFSNSGSGSRSNSITSNKDVDTGSSSSPFNPSAPNSRLWTEDNTLSEEGPLLLFTVYRGHSADVLDISWSKNHFLLSSSMDKTVRLWHITRVECLCTLRHADFVTTTSFHPKDDRYFLSGSLDGKLRLWNIPDKRVTLWNEVPSVNAPTSKKDLSQTGNHGLITASAFVQNGKFAVVGTYDGRVIFYSTDQLKYFTQLHVTAKGLLSSANNEPSEHRGRSSRRNNKVTGIENVDENKILVTTNDSRIRLYDLRDLSLACKYKGCVNVSSQIRASVSVDNKYIICGSENSAFFIWRLQETTGIGQRRDKNNQWEMIRIMPSSAAASTMAAAGAHLMGTGAIGGVSTGKPTNAGIITAATFAPAARFLDNKAKYVIATTDFNGYFRLFSK